MYVAHIWSINMALQGLYKDCSISSLTISVAFLLTHIKQESSTIILAHAQFLRSATLPTLVYAWAYVTHVIMDTGLPLFSRVN